MGLADSWEDWVWPQGWQGLQVPGGKPESDRAALGTGRWPVQWTGWVETLERRGEAGGVG